MKKASAKNKDVGRTKPSTVHVKKAPCRISIVLVEPKVAGNIGAVARAMLNFDIDDLVLIKPCERGQESFSRAMHADKVLKMARVYDDIDKALKGYNFIVGTSDTSTQVDRKHLRKAVTPKELMDHLKNIPGRVAILFGREDFGLYNTELEKCDLLVTIPNSDKYPVMNLSHAVAVVLYELFLARAEIWKPTISTTFERGKLLEMFKIYMDTVEFPTHKRKNAITMFKRIIGRSDISKWEFYTLMGVFSRAVKKINRINPKKEGTKREKRNRLKI